MTQDFKPPVSTFLSAGERETWYIAEHPFTIVGVKAEVGKYGAAHVYKLATVDSKTGEVLTHWLSLSANARRDEEYDWLCEKLLEDSTGVGPVKLDKVPTGNGQDAWVFAPLNA